MKIEDFAAVFVRFISLLGVFLSGHYFLAAYELSVVHERNLAYIKVGESLETGKPNNSLTPPIEGYARAQLDAARREWQQTIDVGYDTIRRLRTLGTIVLAASIVFAAGSKVLGRLLCLGIGNKIDERPNQ